MKDMQRAKDGGNGSLCHIPPPTASSPGELQASGEIFITNHEMQGGWRVKYLLGRFFLKIKKSWFPCKNPAFVIQGLSLRSSNLKLPTEDRVQTSVSLL